MVQVMGDGEGEYGDEVEDEEAYERTGSAFDRYGGAGAGSFSGTDVVGGVYGRYEARKIEKSLKRRGESICFKF